MVASCLKATKDLTHIIVGPAALKMLPRELARRYRMFPVALDRQAKKFIVALAGTSWNSLPAAAFMPDPDSQDVRDLRRLHLAG